MITYIKNINAPHERIENFLNQLAGTGKWTRIKDTYTIPDTNEQMYEQMIEFQKELQEEINVTIFVKRNGL